MLYGAAYYPEHRDPARWAFDLDRMAEAHVNAVRAGEFAWDRFEPEPGRYAFDWFDRWLELAEKKNIGVVLCPPLRTPPAWLVERCPDVAIIREDGVRLEFGTRYSFCVTHPELLDRTAALADQLARHYGPRASVLGWHLDNEHGDEPDCHCPRCRTLFQAFCRARYGEDLERLNDAWGLDFWSLRFNRFEQIPTPAVSKTWHGPGHWLAWRRFRSQATIDAALRQRDALLPRRAAAQFVTTNHQVLHNARVDYFDFARRLDACGTNFYPNYGRLGEQTVGLANVRGYKAGQNFHVFELKNGGHLVPGLGGNTPAPGEVERLALQCVAHGAAGLFYFRWRSCPFGCEQTHGTITDYDGQPLAVYPEIRRVGAWLAKYGPRLDATRVVSRAAVLYDFPTRWLREYRCHWNGPHTLYLDSVRAAYAALRAEGLNADTTGRDADWDGYRLLLVPGLAAVDDALAAKLAAYIERGGVVLAWPQTAHLDEEGRYRVDRLPPALAAAFGATYGDFWTAEEGADVPVRWRGEPGQRGGHHGGETAAAIGPGRGRLFGERARLGAARTLAEYAEGPWAGFAAATAHEYGDGAAVVAMTYPDGTFTRALLAYALEQANLTPPTRNGMLPNGPLPPSMELVERENGEESWVFALNHDTVPFTVNFPAGGKDALADDAPVAGSTTIAPGACRAVVYRK